MLDFRTDIPVAAEPYLRIRDRQARLDFWRLNGILSGAFMEVTKREF